MMARYFKMIEIDCDSFFKATGEDLGFFNQLCVPVYEDGFVYGAIDETENAQLFVPLELFDVATNGEEE